MVKVVIGIVARDDMSHEEFEEYYFETHAPIAEEIPNLERYVVSVAQGEDNAYDAVAELHFEDAAAMREGMSSEAAKEALEDLPNFADPDAGFDITAEEHVVVE